MLLKPIRQVTTGTIALGNVMKGVLEKAPPLSNTRQLILWNLCIKVFMMQNSNSDDRQSNRCQYYSAL